MRFGGGAHSALVSRAASTGRKTRWKKNLAVGAEH